jgi:hypothetical protein
MKSLRMAFVAVAFLVPLPPAAAQLTQVRISRPVDPSDLITLRGNTHPLARPEFDRGAAPDSQPINRMLLVLKRSSDQEAALRQLLDEQQAKSSPRYHQWLTPEQFGRQFGPADADIQAVTDWLASQGFQGVRTGAGRTVIEFSGTAGMVRQSLHTEIHKFVVNAEEHWANVSDPQIPAALAPVIAGIASLNNFPRLPLSRQAGTFSRSKSTGEVRPLFTFNPGTGPVYAVGPADFGTIYDVQPLWQSGLTGTGQTIAVVGETNINIKDVEDFRSVFGLAANDPIVILDGPDPGIVPGDEPEADIDVQWAGAVAPKATIDFVVSETTESTVGIDLSALYIIDNNLAPVMSESYGACEASLGAGGNAFYNDLWEQGAAQGITIVIAAGDAGSAACTLPGDTFASTGLAISGLASTPFNTAVGGTDFDDVNAFSTYWNSTNASSSQASAKSYIPEVPWNNSCANAGVTGCASVTTPDSDGFDVQAGAGGPSTCGVWNLDGSACASGYAKPPWQTGSGVPKDGVRDLPDIAMFAGNGNNDSVYVFCEADANPLNVSSCNLSSPYQDFQGAGGTSVPTPGFAAIMALVNQKTGERQGNADYVLYRLAAEGGASCTSNASAVSNSACIFYDVASGNNSVLCQGGTPDCSATSTAKYGAMVEPSSASTAAWNAGPGYDLATGLGSLNANNLVNRWSSVSFSPTTTTLVSLSPATITHGQTVNVTVDVTSASGTPTGSVALIGGPMSSLGITDFPLSSGSAAGSTNLLPGGTYNVTARYGGDGAFGASTSSPPVQVTVNKESSQTHVALVTFDANGNPISFTATTAPYGSFYVLRTDVTNSAGEECSLNAVSCPTGTVTLSANGRALPNQGSSSPSSYNLNSQGYLEDAFIQFPAGSYSVHGSYGGDSSFQPSSSTVPMAITKAVTTAAFAASSTSIQYGQSVTLTATISTQSSGAAPTGVVQFYSGSTPLAGTVSYTGTSGIASSTGFATLQAVLVLNLAATGAIQANYSGDGNYSSAISARTTVTVAPGFSFSGTPTSFDISAPGQSGDATLSVGFGPAFSGAVSFSCALPATMAAATCTMSPASLSASGKSMMTIATTAASATTHNPPGGTTYDSPPAIVLLVGGLLLMLMLALMRRRPRLALPLFASLLLVAGWVACGGGSSSSGGGGSPGTAPGMYSVTVTATGGSVSHTAAFTVTVQ